MATKLVALLLVAVSFAEARVDYRGHKVLEMKLDTREQAKVVHELEEAGLADVWTAVIGQEAHLRVSPRAFKRVNTTLFDAGLVARVGTEDVQEWIDLERRTNERANQQRGRASWIGTAFVRYSEIVSWIQSLPTTYPTMCAMRAIGKSYENRDIYALRISNNIAQSGSRPIMFVEAQVHAREWLAHASTAWIVNELLTGYGTNSRITKSLQTFEWHIIVMSNPDGYEYTWTNDRLWRKTRSKQSGTVCFGVDPNRNFDDGHHCGEGTSSNPCSETYCGPSPFSEKETAVIRDYTTPLASRIVTWQSVHTYSQLLLLPFGYTANAYPPDFTTLSAVAKQMTDAIFATSRKVYVPGNVVDLLYPAAGATMDFARAKLGIKYPMTWELRPSQNAANGFIVPPSEIEPTGEELLAGMLTLSEVASA